MRPATPPPVATAVSPPSLGPVLAANRVPAATSPSGWSATPLTPTDLLRDVGALIALIWTLNVPWTSAGSGGRLVYVLLPVICSMVALVLPHLTRLLLAADGRPISWRTLELRVALNIPLAISIAVAVVVNIVRVAGGSDDGDPRALGIGVMVSGFAVALASVPRLSELRGRADRDLITRRWRLAAGWAAGLGLASIVISTAATMVPIAKASGGSALALLLLIALVEIGFFAAIFAVPVLRVGADHQAWQPSALWLILMLLVVALAVGGGGNAVESIGSGFYGMWLLACAGGLCATPLGTGRDGSPAEAQFWGLVVANAFRIVVVCCGIIAALGLVAMISIGQSASVPGETIVAFVMVVLTLAAAAVGSSRLRVGVIQGRPAALGAVAFMVLLNVIELAVSGIGWSETGGAGTAVGLTVLFGTYGVIVVGLTLPAPIRAAARSLSPAPAATGGVAAPPPVGSPWGARVHPQAPAHRFPSTGWPAESTGMPGLSSGAEQTVPAQHWPAAPVASAAADDDVERTVMRRGAPPPPSDDARGLPSDDALARAAVDPGTPLRELMTIAHVRPDLRPAVAANPSAYPDLLTWLGQLGDPAVDAALAMRPDAATPR